MSVRVHEDQSLAPHIKAFLDRSANGQPIKRTIPQVNEEPPKCFNCSELYDESQADEWIVSEHETIYPDGLRLIHTLYRHKEFTPEVIDE